MYLTGFLLGITYSAMEGLANNNELIIPNRNAIGSTSFPETQTIPAINASTKNTPPTTLKACAYSLIHNAILMMFLLFLNPFTPGTWMC